jgi:DNA-binding NarL/FixJ family response regulator
MTIYTITLRNPPTVGEVMQYKCQAANDAEASEQVFSVYPDCDIITYTTKEERDIWYTAAHEYAFILRCEGASYKEIAARIGTARSTAEQWTKYVGRRLSRAMKRTRFHYE